MNDMDCTTTPAYLLFPEPSYELLGLLSTGRRALWWQGDVVFGYCEIRLKLREK